ncbi:iron-containing redox enzyme family protein [Promicromonospora thailandica]|uniref:Iron-containing redox enzyme n=1 Tax=Promicromonospora thailandica TaxID=765201 RepID=A0A9X2G593_9MICO|nr:iron-containing redox enzyme family protein [Promicromonospora thailandica]MCP2267029.1 Iron-containing redox enzyme [Promicromonospora thailandica]BFF16692.1 iron-containing redox enzyme family protein [Promicromonospora thailandica]
MTSTAIRDSAPTSDDARPGPARLPLPRPRGPVSTALLAALTAGPPDGDPARLAAPRDAVAEALAAEPDLLADADLQLALTVLYELHHRGVDRVDDAWEWDPGALAVRQALEGPFEAALRARAAQVRGALPEPAATDAAGVAAYLFELAAADGAPSLARYVAKRADAEQVRELLALRSLYQLKEADPHTWAIPRLSGAPKAALVEIQADEYGGGQVGRMHAELFARTMRGAGLDDTYGRYVDLVPAPVLVALNTMSLLGLHRRLRGAIAGHLAAFEMTSSIPSRLVGDGLRRLGHEPGTTEYFDEHVEADAVHEQIAARDLAGRLAEDDPALRDDVLFGAAVCLAVEGDVAAHALDRWRAGASALLAPLDGPLDGRG